MKSPLRRKITTLLLSISLLLFPRPAKADYVSRGQVAAVIIGAVAVGAAIGVGIYFIVRKNSSITGCAASGSSSLSLQNEGDQQTYTLTGDIANIKAGDRIKVSGKKKKRDASGKRDFFMEKLVKDYGACKAPPATP